VHGGMRKGRVLVQQLAVCLSLDDTGTADIAPAGCNYKSPSAMFRAVLRALLVMSSCWCWQPCK
jgi:hypothetical protein